MNLYRSILSVAFAVMVLFSSSSFMVGVHSCGGKVQNIAFFTKAKACGMEKKLPPCHKHISKPCCEDEAVVHSGDDFSSSSTALSLTPICANDIVAPAALIAEIIPTSVISKTFFYRYSPPLRSTDLTVSLQVFII